MLNRHRLIISAMVLLLPTAAACSTGSSSPSAANNSSQSASFDPLKANLAKYSAEPHFTAPGPAFDASKAKGKTIMSIPINSQIPYIVDVDKVQEEVAGQVGVKWIECTNQGTVSDWIGCMNQAISQKVDLINLSQLPNPASLQPQIKAARAAGIAVISTHGPDPATYPAGTVPPEGTANLTSFVPGPFVQVAQLDADYGIVDSGGKADVLRWRFYLHPATSQPCSRSSLRNAPGARSRCSTPRSRTGPPSSQPRCRPPLPRIPILDTSCRSTTV